MRRAAAVSLGLVLGSTAAPALAAPETWTEPDNPSFVGAVLLIGVPVVAIIAILALLTYLPSMIGRGRGGEIAYDDPAWFGGPRTGVSADTEQVTEGTGGSGGRW